jgi:putative acetyltransferase
MAIPLEITTAWASPSEYAAVRALIVQGLSERWSGYDPRLNPDLEAFGTFYEAAIVAVARVDGRIVGCGVLVPQSECVGRIVRMSVAANQRRTGVGGKVLAALIEAARHIGYSELVLETTATWVSAISFYRKHGFVPTHFQDGDQHFMLTLSDDADRAA